jgi:hypothetical protein
VISLLERQSVSQSRLRSTGLHGRYSFFEKQAPGIFYGLLFSVLYEISTCWPLPDRSATQLLIAFWIFNPGQLNFGVTKSLWAGTKQRAAP